MKLPGLPTRILAAALVLVLALIGLIVREGQARAQGTEARLEIGGYDPRSLLTGHYVQFQLESQGPCPDGANTAPWIALAPLGDHHAPIAVGKTREAAGLSGIAVRGRMTCLASPGMVGGVTLDLGVDRLHVDQRQAEALQKSLQARGAERQPAYAVISVGRDGKARLKGLIVGGRRVMLDWF